MKTHVEYFEGKTLCPYSPYANSTALMTSQGDYYLASTIDFTETDPVIFKGQGKPPLLRTVQYDPKWLSGKKILYISLLLLTVMFRKKLETLKIFRLIVFNYSVS